MTAAIDVYYDAWVIGFHHSEHGEVFYLGPRSIGRDVYGGWRFEAGARAYKEYTGYDETGDSNIAPLSKSLLIVGLGWGGKTYYTNPSTTAIIAAYYISAGLGMGGRRGLGYAEFEYDIGIRVPMQKNALSFIARFIAAVGLPEVTEIATYYGNNRDFVGFGAINLTLQYALNFDK